MDITVSEFDQGAVPFIVGNPILLFYKPVDNQGTPWNFDNANEPVMTKFASTFLLSLLLCACGDAQSGSGNSNFLIEVEGMPRLEGKPVVSMGMGSNRQYTMGTSDATVSISTPGDRIMIKFNESGVNCGNYGDVTLEIGDDRAVLSGEVGCLAPGAHPKDRESATITGWFDLDN
jgi:hypothetical protein